MNAALKHYTGPIWMTYRQAAELGRQVRKGEHGSAVAYADKRHTTETDNQASLNAGPAALKSRTALQILATSESRAV